MGVADRPRLQHHPYQEDFIDTNASVVESGDEANNKGIFLIRVTTKILQRFSGLAL